MTRRAGGSAIRLFFSVAATTCVSLGAFVLTLLNGYCGDGSDEGCGFRVGLQAGVFLIACTVIGGLAAFGASGFPRLERRRRMVVAASGGVVLLVAAWVLLIAAGDVIVDFRHDHFGGSKPASFERLQVASALLALLTPPAVWLLAGPARTTARLLSYATATAAASWLLAYSWFSWFVDRNS